MKQHLIVAGLVMLASSALADPVLVPIEPLPLVSITAWLDRPHADDQPAYEPRVAADKDSAENAIETRYGARHKHHRHHHRRHRH